MKSPQSNPTLNHVKTLMYQLLRQHISRLSDKIEGTEKELV